MQLWIATAVVTFIKHTVPFNMIIFTRLSPHIECHMSEAIIIPVFKYTDKKTSRKHWECLVFFFFLLKWTKFILLNS